MVYAPTEYPEYTPGYYAVFFDDPINGIQWELARLPTVPSPAAMWRTWRALRPIRRRTPSGGIRWHARRSEASRVVTARPRDDFEMASRWR